MEARGITLEIPKEIKDQMARRAQESEEERTRLHEQIAEDLGVKHKPNQDFNEIGSQASVVTGITQSTDGRNTYRTFNTGQIQDEYYTKSDELLQLMIKLREMDPDNAIFEKPGYRLEDEEGSLTSMTDIEKAVKFAAMRQQINQLHQTIKEVEQLSTVATSVSTPAAATLTTAAILPASVKNSDSEGSGATTPIATRTPVAETPTTTSLPTEAHPRSAINQEEVADGPQPIRGGGDAEAETEEDEEEGLLSLRGGGDDEELRGEAGKDEEHCARLNDVEARNKNHVSQQPTDVRWKRRWRREARRRAQPERGR